VPSVYFSVIVDRDLDAARRQVLRVWRREVMSRVPLVVAAIFLVVALLLVLTTVAPWAHEGQADNPPSISAPAATPVPAQTAVATSDHPAAQPSDR
jgi:hypothetical protein